MGTFLAVVMMTLWAFVFVAVATVGVREVAGALRWRRDPTDAALAVALFASLLLGVTALGVALVMLLKLTVIVVT